MIRDFGSGLIPTVKFKTMCVGLYNASMEVP